MTALNDLRRQLRAEYGVGNYRIGKDGTIRARRDAGLYWKKIGTAGKGKFRPRGRPADPVDGRKRTVFLNDITWARASRMGNGNHSLGIRRALEFTDP